VKKEIVDTVSTIVKISGKSSRSIQRLCSFLKLPEEIQNALREGTISPFPRAEMREIISHRKVFRNFSGDISVRNVTAKVTA
jgi:hypothetical protein